MMWPFKCKHPAASLFVKRQETREKTNADFERVTYHFICNRCGSDVQVRYANMIGGVNAFLARKDAA